jgi:hypothetical protein
MLAVLTFSGQHLHLIVQCLDGLCDGNYYAKFSLDSGLHEDPADPATLGPRESGHPVTKTILKFVVGSYGLDSVRLTEIWE